MTTEHVDPKVTALVNDAIRTAEEGAPMDAVVARMKEMGDVDRVMTWTRIMASYTNMTLAVKRLHGALSHLVMESFSVPVGPAGMGVKPVLSAELSTFLDRPRGPAVHEPTRTETT